MKGLILLIEDNEQILKGNERMLKRRGYDVMIASTLDEAKMRMNEEKPDVIVLDIMLPDGNGLNFMREFRLKSKIPILLLTGLTTSEDIVCGLSNGGDDYLTKPYDFDVLLARVEALIRRSTILPEVLQKDELKLDIVANRVFFNGEDLLLTQKDFSILLLFTQNENQVIRVQTLYEKIWKTTMGDDTQAVKSAISRLRKKLSGSGYTISSIRGEGYMFERE